MKDLGRATRSTSNILYNDFWDVERAVMVSTATGFPRGMASTRCPWHRSILLACCLVLSVAGELSGDLQIKIANVDIGYTNWVVPNWLHNQDLQLWTLE